MDEVFWEAYDKFKEPEDAKLIDASCAIFILNYVIVIIYTCRDPRLDCCTPQLYSSVHDTTG